MNNWAKFRTQLALQLLLTLTSLGLVGWLAAGGERIAAFFWAVPTVGMVTRVLVLVRLHRMGMYAEDQAQRPPIAVANRQVSVIFIVQFVCWLAAACVCAVIAEWVVLALALFLAALSISMARFLRRPALQQPATTATSSPQSPPG